MKPTSRKSWAGNLFMWSDFDLRPLLEGQMWVAKLKCTYNSLIIGPRGLQYEPTYRKSWFGNILMWSDLTLGPSFKVKQGQPNLKVLITLLLLVLEGCNVKPTYRISYAGNLLMWSDLASGLSNEGSLALVRCLSSGYKFASVVRCARSSLIAD